ncbi:SusC/RagA family TonB-linked outer membrane protein [Flavobacterium zepuense]|uniref:SusC/RagA family TonB-linked outer membrane protein n=1 Tax=Flavobacterium zepuense TaxID=2593302 RepID=A0A552V3U2_9FLAO|nr:SusC/RagA family TonB-linked outer membrane protein [Flavobacterium zepuense]TRW25123.1 SusC/RagA family TonB-linked outer membrane protein [Flavobacterium zepuense]
MKSKFTWIFTLLLAFFIQFSFAQEKTVTGTVVDDANMPVPGANVKVEGSSNGVQTDFDGKFSIQASAGQKLVITYVGMNDQVVTVGAGSTIPPVVLKSGIDLGGVVVEGYRTTARPRSNVAVTTISSETIEGRPNVSFIQSLQGQIPGLNISTGSGSPGSAQTSVILRGLGSLSGNTEPLYVIDGVPSNLLNFRTINGNDIESVSVLKDAGATSVYGNRGANGVIVVKTKRGSFDSGLKIRYSGVTGFTTLQDHHYQIMSGQQLLTLERLKGSGLGATGGVDNTPMTDAEIAAAPNTNWQDVFFRTGISQDHSLSFSQGSKNTNSFVSLGYFEQDGIVPNTDIKRISLRSNFTGKSSNEKFNYTTNLYAGYSRRNELEAETRSQTDPTFAGNVLQNPLQGMLSSLPYLDPAVYQNGRQLFDDFGQPSFGATPYMLMDYIKNIYNQYNEVKLLFNGSASYKLTDDLTAGVNGGIDFTENQRVFARLPQSYLAIVSAEAGGYADFPGLETQSTTRDFSFNGNARLNYNKVIADKHTIDASLMTEYYKAHYKANGFTTIGLNSRTYAPGSGTGYVPFSAATPNLFNRTVNSSKLEAGLFSYFGMFDYDYDSKYGLGVSVRRDASYRFVQDNQWGTFWSVSGRWNLDREKFMEGSTITELKLRGSIGTAGNQNIGGESPYALPNLSRALYSTTTGYNNQPGLVISQLANPTIQWETTSQANIGVDFVWNKRVRGTVDVYRKYTKDLFQGVPVSAINGQYLLNSNYGNMENKGIEALLAYDIVKGQDFNLTISANGSYNRNRLKNQPTENQFLGDVQIQSNDQIAFQYYTVRYAGVNPSNGNALYYDANGTLTENSVAADRVATGKSPIPVYQGGFGFNADYKGFYASAQFTFVADVWRFDYDLQNLQDPTSIGTFPQSTDQNRAWTPDNPNTDIPSIFATNTANDALSDRFLRDSSYLRLKYATVGYNVPSKFLDQTFLSSVRVYAQAENFLTWTKWRGFDPESNAASTFGGYPTPRVFSFGVDLQF